MLRVVPWIVIALGALSGAAGYLGYRRADRRQAEAASYRRELQATIEALEEDARVRSALPKTLAWTHEAAERAAKAARLEADVRVEGEAVEVVLKGAAHRDVLTLLRTLEEAGVEPASVMLDPNPETRRYARARVLLRAEGGGAR